jgi:hypothetical protein
LEPMSGGGGALLWWAVASVLVDHWAGASSYTGVPVGQRAGSILAGCQRVSGPSLFSVYRDVKKPFPV